MQTYDTIGLHTELLPNIGGESHVRFTLAFRNPDAVKTAVDQLCEAELLEWDYAQSFPNALHIDIPTSRLNKASIREICHNIPALGEAWRTIIQQMPKAEELFIPQLDYLSNIQSVTTHLYRGAGQGHDQLVFKIIAADPRELEKDLQNYGITAQAQDDKTLHVVIPNFRAFAMIHSIEPLNYIWRCADTEYNAALFQPHSLYDFPGATQTMDELATAPLYDASEVVTAPYTDNLPVTEPYDLLPATAPLIDPLQTAPLVDNTHFRNVTAEVLVANFSPAHLDIGDEFQPQWNFQLHIPDTEAFAELAKHNRQIPGASHTNYFAPRNIIEVNVSPECLHALKEALPTLAENLEDQMAFGTLQYLIMEMNQHGLLPPFFMEGEAFGDAQYIQEQIEATRKRLAQSGTATDLSSLKCATMVLAGLIHRYKLQHDELTIRYHTDETGTTYMLEGDKGMLDFISSEYSNITGQHASTRIDDDLMQSMVAENDQLSMRIAKQPHDRGLVIRMLEDALQLNGVQI